MHKFDFLVLGGGIAGLTYALDVASFGSVAILFKKTKYESATSWAQGGVAAVSTPDDSFELHSSDTMEAGSFLSNKNIVDLVVREGPERVSKLVERGVQFDRKSSDGTYDLTREGGHSTRRIMHARDATGAEIQRALLDMVQNHPNITLFEGSSAVDLITTKSLGIKTNKNNTAVGAYVLIDSGEIIPFIARKILVATGGAGKVYLYTSNPDVATGDGIAMCFRAGAPVGNLEFFQFHPTCLYHPEAKSFLITEAMRGEGGILRRINGEPFMARYHTLAELAPRDVVARAIDHEMKRYGEDHVLLDMTHKSSTYIQERFPNIYLKCKELGIDITTTPIPVVPAAHYSCGGVITNELAQTNIENLYVAGESACTGLHGANRLASNSLLEALVFSSRAAQDSIKTLSDTKFTTTPRDWDKGSATNSDEAVVISQTWEEIRRFMWNYVGIVRTDKRLERAKTRSDNIEREITEYYWDFLVTSDLLELRNLSLVANLVISCALLRKESRGLHFNLDYPESRSQYLKDTVIYPPNYQP